VLSENKFLNEANHNPPPLQVKWSVPYEKACLRNNYICSISTLNDSNTSKPDFPLRTNTTIDLFQITPGKILDILQILKLGKASDLDTISHQMLKKTCNNICVPLSLLFILSLSKSEFPKQWEIASVMPLFKKGDKSLISNNRPKLSAVGKIFERIVFREVFNHLISNNLLYKFQSGFIPGHSTVHQLIEIYYRICMSLDDHCFTTLILCDISKACDRVRHTGLILKLKAYGIEGKLFKWFESYISSRKQYVFIYNSKSPLVNTKAGVPQGSVFDPLPFLLYVNDIADNLLRFTRLFAVDTSLSYSSQNPYTIEDVMNSDMEYILVSIWSKQWLVNFNPQKIKQWYFPILIFSSM
jgi:hypothetical protein